MSATHHVYMNLKTLKQNIYFSFCVHQVRKYVCYFSGTDSKHTGHGYLAAARLWVKKRTSVGILVNCTLGYSYLPDVSVYYSESSAGSTVAVSWWHTVRHSVVLPLTCYYGWR
jgi:hypothetical protein